MALNLTLCLAAITPVEQAGRAEAVRQASAASEAEARGDLESAENGYLKALELAPDWAEVMVNLGVLYNRQGRTQDAVRAFTRAAELKPSLTAALVNLGITHFRSGRYDEAVGPLKRALTAEPSNLQARQLLALSLMGLERFEEAVVELEAVRAANDKDPALLTALGHRQEN